MFGHNNFNPAAFNAKTNHELLQQCFDYAVLNPDRSVGLKEHQGHQYFVEVVPSEEFMHKKNKQRKNNPRSIRLYSEIEYKNLLKNGKLPDRYVVESFRPVVLRQGDQYTGQKELVYDPGCDSDIEHETVVYDLEKRYIVMCMEKIPEAVPYHRELLIAKFLELATGAIESFREEDMTIIWVYPEFKEEEVFGRGMLDVKLVCAAMPTHIADKALYPCDL